MSSVYLVSIALLFCYNSLFLIFKVSFSFSNYLFKSSNFLSLSVFTVSNSFVRRSLSSRRRSNFFSRPPYSDIKLLDEISKDSFNYFFSFSNLLIWFYNFSTVVAIISWVSLNSFLNFYSKLDNTAVWFESCLCLVSFWSLCS